MNKRKLRGLSAPLCPFCRPTKTKGWHHPAIKFTCPECGREMALSLFWDGLRELELLPAAGEVPA